MDLNAFQFDAYQSGAFQSEVATEWAFQQCAFQADAFQADACQVAPPEETERPSVGGLRFRRYAEATVWATGNRIRTKVGAVSVQAVVVEQPKPEHVVLRGLTLRARVGVPRVVGVEVAEARPAGSTLTARAGSVEVLAVQVATCFAYGHRLAAKTGLTLVSAGGSVMVGSTGLRARAGSVVVKTVRNPTDEEIAMIYWRMKAQRSSTWQNARQQ